LLYIIACIILTSWLTIAFKLVGQLGLDTFQVIVFNYITCLITGSWINGSLPLHKGILNEAWLPWAILMGAAFISIFCLVGFTTQRLGVAIASVSFKLSLVIPFVFSIILYNESATIIKMAGIVMALVAVVLTCLPAGREDTSPAKRMRGWVLVSPALLFLSSGLLDTTIKYVEQAFLNESNQDNYLSTAFGSAAAIGFLILIILIAIARKKFSLKSVIAGIAVGLPNYFSIWFMVKVLKAHTGNSSAIIPLLNMSVVVFSTVVAWVFFREKLSLINKIGIVLGLIAISCIAFG